MLQVSVCGLLCKCSLDRCGPPRPPVCTGTGRWCFLLLPVAPAEPGRAVTGATESRLVWFGRDGGARAGWDGSMRWME